MYSLLVISCRAHKHFAIHIRMETSELMKSNARQADPVLSRAQQARRVPPSKRTYMKSKSAIRTRRRQLQRAKAVLKLSCCIRFSHSVGSTAAPLRLCEAWKEGACSGSSDCHTQTNYRSLTRICWWERWCRESRPYSDPTALSGVDQ